MINDISRRNPSQPFYKVMSVGRKFCGAFKKISEIGKIKPRIRHVDGGRRKDPVAVDCRKRKRKDEQNENIRILLHNPFHCSDGKVNCWHSMTQSYRLAYVTISNISSATRTICSTPRWARGCSHPPPSIPPAADWSPGRARLVVPHVD